MEKYIVVHPPTPHFTLALQNDVSIHLCRLFMNVLRLNPFKNVFIYAFYRISISRAHCYVMLTLFFPHFSSK